MYFNLEICYSLNLAISGQGTIYTTFEKIYTSEHLNGLQKTVKSALVTST